MKQITFLLFLLISNSIFSQKVSGIIKNTHNQPLSGVHIIIIEDGTATISDKKGFFILNISDKKKFTLQISHIGYKLVQKEIDLSLKSPIEIILDTDFLSLDEIIVTGTHIPNSNKKLSMAVSSISNNEISKYNINGTATLLQNITGVYVDDSAGEVFTRVYSRGISISAEDDLGWYYTGLHEDGLPTTVVQFASFSPDLFYRIDGTIDHVEVVRGGSASISGMNTPGGIFNFISKSIPTDFQGLFSMNTGLHENGNLYNKTNLTLSGPINKRIGYQIGATYRFDQGSRNIDYNLSNGGQIKYKLNYKFEKGSLELYGKFLNDHVNRWTGVTAKNWDNPVAAFDQNFKTTAQLIPNPGTKIPDGTGGYYEFDPSNGIHVKDNTVGLLFKTKLSNNWNLENNFKYSSKSANWQTTLANSILTLDSFLPYFISGADFPVGQIIFKDAKTSEELAQVNNLGILGDPPSFDYLTDGRLPNDAIMGFAAWYKDDKNKEFMNQLTIHGTLKNHELHGGIFASSSKIQTLTRASFAYASYEARPTALSTTLENPGSEILFLSDSKGYSNYGGLFFEKAEAKVKQIHFFVQDQWKINDKLLLDLGIRIEQINHKGDKDRSESLNKVGGWDGDEQTAYDNSILIPSGVKDAFDYNYSNFSYSLGLNYELADNFHVFGRFSKGGKAPELDYYFNNFSNIAINKAGPIQKILQTEAGVKFNSKQFTIVPVFFWSELSNVGTSNFVFDQDNNTIFYTPIQYNSTRTIGLELESVYHPNNNFNLKMNVTFQHHEAVDFSVYNANGTVDESDDEIVSYNGNKLPFNPNLMLNITPEYHIKKIEIYLNWRYMGERQGNIANSFQLPAYSIFNFGTSYQISSKLEVGLHIKNIFSSNGLMNFYGPNSFGASKDDATEEYIANNPDGNFIITPVQPRLFHINLSYAF